MVEWDWPTYILFGGVLSFAFIGLRQYDNFKGQNRFIYLLIALLPFFCLFAFRHQAVGRDLAHYAMRIYKAKYGAEIFFSNFLSGSILSEPISTSLAYVSYHLKGIQSYIFLTTIVQFIFIATLLRSLHLKRFNVAIFFLLFVSVIQLRSCSMVRNGLAIAASFCAYVHLLDNSKNQKWFWFYSIIALGFHNSAIINLPIYFICKPIAGDYWAVVRNIVLKLCAVGITIAMIFLLRTGYFVSLIESTSDGIYASYQMGKTWGVGNILTRLPLLCLFLFHLRGLKDKYGNNITAFLYLMIFDIIISQTRYIYPDFERLTQYSAFGEIFFLTIFYDYIKEKTQFPIQWVYVIIVIGYFTYYMYYWAIVAEYGLMPYKFTEW